MTRRITITAMLLLSVFLCGTAVFAQTAKTLPMDRYFPYYTAEYTSIPDLKKLSEQFEKTDIGTLASKPEMKPFRDSVRGEFERNSRLQERLGITLSDLRHVASGEVAFGIVYPNKDLLAMALMADITNHSAEANQLVNKVCTQAAQKGGKSVRQKVGTAEFIQLDVLDKNNVNRKIVYVIDGNFMVICDNLTIAKLLWQKAINAPATASIKPLASSAYYQAIYKQSMTSTPREVFEFTQIDRYAEAMYILNGKYSTSKLTQKNPIDGMKTSGLIGFKAAGGSYQFKPEGYDRFCRGYILAPAPWTASMNVFKFNNVPCPEPPAWVGANTSMFAAIQSTPSAIYENIGPLFDVYFGQGEAGVWQDVVNGLEKDPMGPQINLQNDLIRYFDGQILFVSSIAQPLTTDSERIAYAIKVTDTEAVRNTLNRLFKDDPTIKPARLGQYNIWQNVPKVKKTTSAMNGPTIQRTSEKEKTERVMAHATIAIENGYLFIVSKADYLQQLLSTPTQSLKDTAGYQKAMAELIKRNGNSASVWIYCPTEINNQYTYELFRMGKITTSKSFVGRIVNSLTTGNKNTQNERQFNIDGRTLPSYEQIKPYFGPAGVYIKSDSNGFLFEGFVLSNN